MKTERLDAVDQTKSQYGQSRKIIHHYLHSARASDYLSHIGPSTSSQTTQNKLPSNKKQNRIQRSLLKELKKEDSSVLDLLSKYIDYFYILSVILNAPHQQFHINGAPDSLTFLTKQILVHSKFDKYFES